MSAEPSSERSNPQQPIEAGKSELLETTLSQTAGRSEVTESAAEARIVEPKRRRFAGSPFIGLILALVGGVLAWIIIQGTYPIFQIPDELQNLGPMASSEQQLAQDVAREKTKRQHAILYTAILGALIGGGLSIAEATKDRSARTAVIAGIVVLAVGSLFGAAGGLLGDIAYVSVRSDLQPLSLLGTALVQVVVLGTVGFGLGLGLGVSRGRLRGAALTLSFAGLLAGLCAGVCYPLIVGFLLPSAQTESTLPTEGMNQLLWVIAASSMVGLIIPMFIESAKPNVIPVTDATVSGESAV